MALQICVAIGLFLCDELVRFGAADGAEIARDCAIRAIQVALNAVALAVAAAARARGGVCAAPVVPGSEVAADDFAEANWAEVKALLLRQTSVSDGGRWALCGSIAEACRRVGRLDAASIASYLAERPELTLPSNTVRGCAARGSILGREHMLSSADSRRRKHEIKRVARILKADPSFVPAADRRRRRKDKATSSVGAAATTAVVLF